MQMRALGAQGMNMESEKIVRMNNLHLIRAPLIYGLIGAFLLIFGSLATDLMNSAGFRESSISQVSVLLRLFAWVIIFASLAMALNHYLKTGFSTSEISIGGPGISFRSSYDENKDRFSDLESRFNEMKSLNQASGSISEADKVQLLDSLKAKFSESLEGDLTAEIKESLQKQIVDERLNYLRKNMESSLFRLSKEVADLSRRGNLNLIIGALATLAGFLIFGMMVLDENFSPSPENFISSFIPRLSLVILIEVFAYFFLGLYKSSLGEIKYFQNEITNIESKYAAMEYAVQYGDKESINSILMQFANTERNFLLKKGESTVLIEQDRMNSESQNSFLQKITDLVSATNAPNK
jgi:hypothetical protein